MIRCPKCGEVMKETKITQKRLTKTRMVYSGIKMTDTKYECIKCLD